MHDFILKKISLYKEGEREFLSGRHVIPQLPFSLSSRFLYNFLHALLVQLSTRAPGKITRHYTAHRVSYERFLSFVYVRRATLYMYMCMRVRCGDVGMRVQCADVGLFGLHVHVYACVCRPTCTCVCVCVSAYMYMCMRVVVCSDRYKW